jgi:DNA-binding beta-propeller fold protein YncE
MTVLCSRKLPPEPWGIARSADDAKLVVSSAWGAALTVLDAKTFQIARTVPLARDPRSVTVDDHGIAFVSHSVGTTLSAVDLGKNEPAARINLGVRKATPLMVATDKGVVRTGSQGFALARTESRVLVPMTSVDPGKFVPDVETATYYGPPFDGVPKQAPIVAVVDASRQRMLTGDLVGTTSVLYRRECLLPRDAAVHAKTHTLFVACRGIDAVLELDANAVDPARAERRRFSVATAPEGVAIDDRGERLVVFSQLGAALTVIPFNGQRRTISLDYHPPASLLAVARGRQLFFRTDDSHISDDGLACASCHVDARDDGITWRTPVGPRQTPMLAGRITNTAPYGWEGNRPTLVDYISHTVVNLGGKGIPIEDVDAIIAYLGVASSPQVTADQSAVAKGVKLFAAGGCDSCHTTGATDGLRHALSTPPHGDVIGGANGTEVDTPTLRFVGGTAPYFHDGRYRTLEDLLADPKSKMGASYKLSAADRGALADYLRTL